MIRLIRSQLGKSDADIILTQCGQNILLSAYISLTSPNKIPCRYVYACIMSID